MSSTGTLSTDPLFIGLTRPTRIFGVTFKFVIMEAVITYLFLINTDNIFIVPAVLVILHGIAYVICFKEPLFLELYNVKFQKCNKCKNRMFHSYTNSYDVY